MKKKSYAGGDVGVVVQSIVNIVIEATGKINGTLQVIIDGRCLLFESFN